MVLQAAIKRLMAARSCNAAGDRRRTVVRSGGHIDRMRNCAPAHSSSYEAHRDIDSTTEQGVNASIALNGSGAARLLVIDDEEQIRRALTRFLRAQGYEVATAASGVAAIELFDRAAFDLALCDVTMPDINGVEVLRILMERDPDLAVVMLTGTNHATTATAALTGGAVDYLVKPVEFSDLDHAVRSALHRRSLSIQRREIERVIREEVAQRTADLEREKASLREMSVGIVEALVNAMEAKDEYLRGHSHRVAALAAAIAAELDLSDEAIEQIRLAARLKDVGRIGVRESILNKAGSLTDEELEHIRSHLHIGVRILSPLKHLGVVLQFIADHHEHWDGGGYPRAVKGTEISIGGRVLAAADAFQAITSKRAYREPLDPSKAIEYMSGLSDTMLDPDVFAALCRVVERGANLPFIGVDS